MIQVPDNLLQWSHYVAASLFALGVFGFFIRRNAIVVLMCVELMLNAINLILVEISMRSGQADGLVVVIFVITVAAAEAAIGLGIILGLYRAKGTVRLDRYKSLRG